MELKILVLIFVLQIIEIKRGIIKIKLQWRDALKFSQTKIFLYNAFVPMAFYHKKEWNREQKKSK